jgi:Sec-independent protein translocase protein TatA
MNILGIGPLELVFILILGLVIFGPRDIQKMGMKIGQGLNRVVKSDAWKTVQQTTRTVKSLPNTLMREAGMEELKRSLDTELLQRDINMTKVIDHRSDEMVLAESSNPDRDSVVESLTKIT